MAPRERSHRLISWHTILAVLVIILLFSWVGSESSGVQDKQNPADAFFENLILGGAEKGRIYLEVPLKPVFFANAKTPEERREVWLSFFKRVLKETPPHIASPDYISTGSVPYWGDFIYKKVDLAYLARSVDLQMGDVIKIRTARGIGTATVIGYEIHRNVTADADLLLAIAQPARDFKVTDANLLVAARELPACKIPCVNRNTLPNPRMLERIRAATPKGANIPENQTIEQIIVLQGYFTTRSRIQYIVYADFGRRNYEHLIGYWRTLVLDTDLSVVALLGENDYTHIKPTSVGDINGDGLDEIWVDLEGYEGTHAGIFYWRGGNGKEAFGWIATAYYGL